MILLCYDGSDGAKVAIDKTAELMPGAEVCVLCVWEPLVETMARAGGWAMSGLPDSADFDAASENAAGEFAAEGASRANDAGLKATPRTVARAGSVAAAIVAVGDDLDAQAIVLGTRGRSELKSLLLGSVSHEVLQHAHRAVVVVPSPEVASGRADALKSRR
jgi:nucleotide-binding universal stress UspA family protein